jgi:TolB-like protein/Tfp pilus assembly protein PilF
MSMKLEFGPFVLDTERSTLAREGRAVPISSRGFELLRALVATPGRVVTKRDLMQAAWSDAAIEESNLSVQIAALRKQLGQAPDGGEWIATVPRSGYRFVGQIAAQPATDRPFISPEDRPSIAVLPFTNLGGEKEQEYLADGITEDIITALIRFRWFFVIARNSSFFFKGQSLDVKQIASDLDVRYLLEGSVRKSGGRVRISAQLIDARSGNHLWAERYDLELTEVFAIQDEIAERVAGAIEPELLKSQGAEAAARHTGNMTAWDLVRRGTWHFHHVTPEHHTIARELFREACKVDPELPEAHIWLARVNAGLIAYDWSGGPLADQQEGRKAALRAIHLDERNPYAHYALAIVSSFSNYLEQAITAARKAIAISPSFALGHLVLGMALLFSGRASEAAPALEQGLRLSPYDPQSFVWFNLLALARLFGGQQQGALDAAVRAQQVRPNWSTTLEVLVCCCSALNRENDARNYMRQFTSAPKQGEDVLAPLKLNNPLWKEQIELAKQSASGQ